MRRAHLGTIDGDAHSGSDEKRRACRPAVPAISKSAAGDHGSALFRLWRVELAAESDKHRSTSISNVPGLTAAVGGLIAELAPIGSWLLALARSHGRLRLVGASTRLIHMFSLRPERSSTEVLHGPRWWSAI